MFYEMLTFLAGTLNIWPLTFKVVTVDKVPAKHEQVGSKGTQFPKKNSSNYSNVLSKIDNILESRFPPLIDQLQGNLIVMGPISFLFFSCEQL